MTTADKVSLRREMRNHRRALGEAQRRAAAAGLLQNLLTLDAFSAAETMAMYLVNDGEIDPVDVMHWCWNNHRKTYVPIVIQAQCNSLVFAPVGPDSRFIENRFGIPEPVVDEAEIIGAADLDLVLLPLVAFDASGNRIGMGGGFYDRTFEFVRDQAVRVPAMIGIAHELQRVPQIDSESWDIPLSTVVTDCGVYHMDG